MNKAISESILFAAKCFIVVFAAYLAMSAMFLRNFQKVAEMTKTLDGQVKSMVGQVQMLSSVMAAGNPEMMYYSAIIDEQAGRLAEAAKKTAMAANLATAHQQKYRQKLQELQQKIP